MEAILVKQILTRASMLSLALVGAACSGADTGVDPNQPGADAPLEVAALSNGILGKEHVKEQGYWYSRYTLGSFIMKSGAGETFAPIPEAMMQMVMMVSDSTSQAAPAMNAALLKRPFDVANPTFVNAPDATPANQRNFENFRWTPVDAAQTSKTSGSAIGQVLVKAAEWAKLFHVDTHFGVVGSTEPLTTIPGAQQRFSGMVLVAESIMMVLDARDNPANYDLTSSPKHAYNWLMALADVGNLLSVDQLPHTDQPNRYKVEAALLLDKMGMPAAPTMGAQVLAMADDFYAGLPAPTNLDERAAAIKALIWYGFASPTNRADVRAKIASYAAQILEDKATTAADQGRRIRALISTWQQTGEQAQFDAAVAEFKAMVRAFDGEAGVFTNQSTYNAEDIAWILGGINAIDNFAVGDVPEDIVNTLLTSFFESTVDMSGFMMAAPPVTVGIPEYERLPNAANVDEKFHRYPNMMAPPAAGGSYGMAPTFGSSVTWNGSWKLDSPMFNTAQAFTLANEMVWLHGDEVDGFPKIP